MSLHDSEIASRAASTSGPATTGTTYGSSASGVRGTVQFRRMSFDEQAAYLSPGGRGGGQNVQKEDAQDAPSPAVGAGGADELTPLGATATSLGGEIPAAELDAVIQAALPKFQEKLKADFTGQVKMRVSASGNALSVDIPTFTPPRDFKGCAHVTDVLTKLKYPSPKPEGSDAHFSFRISIPAKRP